MFQLMCDTQRKIRSWNPKSWWFQPICFKFEKTPFFDPSCIRHNKSQGQPWKLVVSIWKINVVHIVNYIWHVHLDCLYLCLKMNKKCRVSKDAHLKGANIEESLRSKIFFGGGMKFVGSSSERRNIKMVSLWAFSNQPTQYLFSVKNQFWSIIKSEYNVDVIDTRNSWFFSTWFNQRYFF